MHRPMNDSSSRINLFLLPRQLILYAVIGITGLVIDAATYGLLRSFMQTQVVSTNIMARHVGAVYTFLGNKIITFRSKNAAPKQSLQQFAGYLLLLYFSIFLSTTALSLGLNILEIGEIQYETALKFGIDGLCAIINFIICKYIIFADK